MNIFPFGEVTGESPAIVRFLAYSWLLLRLQLAEEYRAWCQVLEWITQIVNDWTYGYVNGPMWRKFERVNGYKCDAEQEWIISKALSTEKGRLELALAMVAPIRGPLEYGNVFTPDTRWDIANHASAMAYQAIRDEEDARVFEELRKAA
jgi:hypothetical protein